ncbi:MAG: hypothetical protein Q8J97_09115 [Flavobacteriaceae bacterium]|nr:hypothetical protein [Flavobacteriaceae bacterium]
MMRAPLPPQLVRIEGAHFPALEFADLLGFVNWLGLAALLELDLTLYLQHYPEARPVENFYFWLVALEHAAVQDSRPEMPQVLGLEQAWLQALLGLQQPFEEHSLSVVALEQASVQHPFEAAVRDSRPEMPQVLGLEQTSLQALLGLQHPFEEHSPVAQIAP